MSHRLRELASKAAKPIRRLRDSRQYTYLQNLGLGFWIFLVLTFSLGFLFVFYIQEFVSVVVSGYGFLGIFILAILLELVVQPIGPDLPLILGTLAGLNGGLVLMFVLLGSYVALYMSYIIGKKIGTPGIERIVGKKTFQKINWSKRARWFMFIGAITPVPYIPYLAGSWNFSFKDTMLFVAIPRTIRLVVVLILTYYWGMDLLVWAIND